MKLIKLSALAIATLISTTAMANTVDTVVDGGKTLLKTATNPAAVSLELGTLGYGANVAWGLSDSVELQAGWAGMNFDVSADIGGDDSVINWKKVLGSEYKDYQGEFKLDVKTSNPYLGAQLRPLNNWLTVGAGVIVPKHEVDATLTATADTKVTVKGTTYDIKEKGVVKISAENHNKLAPYATLGFRPNINNRFGAFAEVGAAYVGKYDTTVEVSGNIPKSESLRQDLEKEVKDSSFAWYPIAKIGATLRF